MDRLKRLFEAHSLAVIGGGVWCASVIAQARKFGFQGDLVAVHPFRKEIGGIPSVARVSDYDGIIDAAFVGVNRQATVDVVAELNALGAGGAVCFASGFSEAAGEDPEAGALEDRLRAAAGDMPVLGPNCYGFINALDQVAVWPDQHGLGPLERGVAILTQSSNIAINLTMQRRALPIAYMITCGNQALIRQSDLALALLNDARVTAIGLHIEGFEDVSAWWDVARKAAVKGVPVLAIKVGASAQARAATLSHTASLAGSDAGANALLRHLGFGRAYDLATFLETLKLLHVAGPLERPALSSISCSGGEASLVADMACDLPISFPALKDGQRAALADALGPMVALANPLDYHTYIWGDARAMASAWAPMAGDHIGLTMSVVDYPLTDASAWDCATQAALIVRAETQRPMAVVASLPELLPQETAECLMAGGVLPMNGLREALEAAALAANWPDLATAQPLDAGSDRSGLQLIPEAVAKTALAGFGMVVPRGCEARMPEAVADLQGPFAVKSTGLAHKSDDGGVRLHLEHDDLAEAMRDMPGEVFLIEEMVQGAVAELLLGVVRDPAHGFVLTIGAGGVLTELMQDSVSLLVPADRDQVDRALKGLRVAPLLAGYRGKPKADVAAILDAVAALQAYVVAHSDTLEEVEINPLICTARGAVAADALIRREVRDEPD